MNFLDQVRAKRQKLADVLSDEDYSGIREIVEELYPDRAHFIYELLQNAEDTGASHANFVLGEDGISFEHNGSPFTEENVWAITNIGKGTKKDQEDQIGRFGVGFKAVFAYSETPYIWSPTFSFKITELVLPWEIPAKTNIDQQTRFEFPFNSLKKIREDAYGEVEAGLNELAETTLLFLSNLESIRWRIGRKHSGEILRIEHPKNHIEVLKNVDGQMAASSHFLRFSQSVTGLEKQQVSVAFELDYLSNVTAFDEKKAIAKQLKIIPATPGRVAVFFPAEKETSGLRFHLHAPFVPELSRASVKETSANDPLFEQLAKLTESSLHDICNLKLLNVDFLGVLPNPQDIIPARYQPIFEAVVAEMNNQPLTPTHSKSHAPAKHLLQAKASLKDLLGPDDLELLAAYKDLPTQWAVGATQRNNNVDRFLSGLAIRKWDIEEFVKKLQERLSDSARFLGAPHFKWVTGPDETASVWLSQKSIDWHQQFYALLYRELTAAYNWHQLQDLKIVRLSDGNYSIGKKCYFPEWLVKEDKILPRVDERVYISGKSKVQQTESRKLLESMGVREVSEGDSIQAILDQRYTKNSERPDDVTYLQDLKTFCRFLEKNPKEAGRFKEYLIFKAQADKWGTPHNFYLDSPFLETRLTEYFTAIERPGHRVPLSNWYTDCGIELQVIAAFAKSVGVLTNLEVVKNPCSENPEWDYLRMVAGDRFTSPIDEDYTIHGLDIIVSNPTIILSKLIWQTMRFVSRKSPSYFYAVYRKNETNGSRRSDSKLLHILRDARWVPQGDGSFVRPCEAESSLLPNGFPFDQGETWLSRLNFGAQSSQRKEDAERAGQLAVDLGFENSGAFERAKKFASIPLEEQEAILAEFERRQNAIFPENEPRSPDRRNERVAEQAKNAPQRIVNKRERSVSVSRDVVKVETKPYLRQQYTNNDGDMICQICKGPMPFRLDSGEFYFEMVEFLPELKLLHFQNYLALCPNHAAMFIEANNSRGVMLDMFSKLADPVLEVVLAQETKTIRFTKTHFADLKKIVEIDKEGKG